MKRAFTIVELLVVIGIICILAGVLFVSLSGGTESARTARCLSNLRNLAAACQTYGAEHSKYPLAGSIEYMKIDESEGIARVKTIYKEVPGWLSWNSKGAYESKPTSPKGGSSWFTSLYTDDDEAASHAYTNGVLWKYVSGNRQTFICPCHTKHGGSSQGGLGQQSGSIKVSPRWSYLMNAYFGWYADGTPQSENYEYIEYGRLAKADKVLLFGEVPFAGLAGSWQPYSTGSGTECDSVLQFDASVQTKTGSTGQHGGSSGNAENIGFNHKSGKMTFATVVFADAHAEKLRLPKSGMSDSDLKNLTAWLCTGTDVTFDGKRYQKNDN